ncbi:MAG: hypothetical protein HY705_09030 [Gemmatimonadetes bacterium]|nr:hypothetical protein [Gemmatimonadota bacterium]
MTTTTSLLPRRPKAAAYALPLERADDPGAVGEKAYNLGRLCRLGVAVPPGLVLTTAAFDALLAADALGERLEALCAGLDPRESDALRETSGRARALILAAAVPEPVREQLHALAAALLPGSPLAVRSSAVGEDSAGASFAGQLDSLLGVQGGEALERALLACWASYWSERALFYQRARGVHLRGMGVIVQRLVDARSAGVLFTSAGRDGMLVEYCAGLGDALVAGHIDPGRVTLARDDLRVTSHRAPEDAAPGLLPADTLAALARTGLELERALGAPQDIEWAADAAGRLFIVQSRPITAPVTAPVPVPVPVPVPESEPESARTLWSNANVAENFPAPISPLLYSIAAPGYTHYFRNLARAFGISRRRVRAMEHPLRAIVGVHGARLYYNLTSIHAVLRMAPFGEALTRAFNDFVGAAATPAPPPDAETFAGRGRLRQLAELAVIAAKTTWQYLFLERRLAAFERTADAFAARTHPDRLAAIPPAELRDRLREFMDIRCNRWTNAALADAASMVCYAALRQLLARGLPEEERGNLHNTLLKALPAVVSSVPAREMWALSRMIREDQALAALFATGDGAEIAARVWGDERFAAFRAALERYLEAWGFRCSEELMLTTPSFQEDPAPLMDLLGAYAAADGPPPEEVMRRQDEERTAETARVLRLLCRRRLHPLLPFVSCAPAARVALAWTKGAIARRERARLKQALLYSRCRRLALALGDRLAARALLERADDVFFLTMDELDALASGCAMFPYHLPALVALRRGEHEELGRMRPPDTFVLGEGEYLEADGAAPGAEAAALEDDAAELRGEGACGGQMTARAAVLRDISEARALAAGDVLVTRQTDPGWGPVFFLVRGLVMERGGMLSHGAIIAREFGIPCVVGVRDATRRIASGRTVTVDGDRGRVRLEE